MSDDGERPESLLPYDEWTSDALRQVMVRALTHAAVQGLPGEHHFYVTFRTDAPGVAIPTRLRAQYPHEMTIVLQHQFWDLKVETASFDVTLSFSGVASPLHIPFGAVVAFADPHVRYGVRFSEPPAAAPEPVAVPSIAPGLLAGPATVRDDRDTQAVTSDGGTKEPEDAAAARVPQVVSLDAFRRRTPPQSRDH